MDWRRIPSLSALRAFEATARHLSFSKAARELNVTHAAMAQHVRGLEAQFSETLVVREGRGLALTESGRKLAARLTTGFEEIAAGVEDIYAVHEDRPLNISVTPSFAANWLMPRIGGFWQDHPDITLNINPTQEVVELQSGAFDLAIRYGDGDWPDLEVQPLTDGDFLVVAHPDLVAGLTINCVEDAAHLPWIMESHMMERKAIIEQEGVNVSDLKLTLMSTNGLVLSGVMAGLGVSVQPLVLVERELSAGRLVQICEVNNTGLGYFCVTHPSRTNAKVRTFKKWLNSVK